MMKSPSTESVSAISLIRSHLPSLASSEARVATWVLQNWEGMLPMSMAQVAHECGVSDTTVLRFCRSAGFHGYMDLKLRLARDTANPSQIIHSEITPEDTIASITQKVFQANIAALRDTLEVMDFESLTRAANLISQAQRVLIIGVGTSSPIVHDAYNKLFRLGLNCRAQTDSYLQLMDAALLAPGDLLIAISQSGLSADPVMTIELAKKNGAGTICITGNAQSAITQHADVTLLSVSNEGRGEAIASRIAQITIIDTLYVILSMQQPDESVQNERRIWDSVLPKTI